MRIELLHLLAELASQTDTQKKKGEYCQMNSPRSGNHLKKKRERKEIRKLEERGLSWMSLLPKLGTMDLSLTVLLVTPFKIKKSEVDSTNAGRAVMYIGICMWDQIPQKIEKKKKKL